jgi:uncharacterized protein (DUF2062 family)
MITRAKQLLLAQLRQGLSPRDCSRAVATGLTIGVFPILGCSTLLNTVCAHQWRLNQAIVQSLNWICAPLKLALIFPFLRLGEFLFQAESFNLSLAELSRRFYADSAATLVEFGWSFMHALTGWLCCIPALYLLLYVATMALIRNWSPKPA